VSFSSATTPRDAGNALANGLSVLRRRWLTVIAVVIASIALAILLHSRATKTYKATANVTFQSSTVVGSVLGLSGGSTVEPQREAATNVLIAHSSEVAAGVAKQLDTSESASALLEEVTVEAAPNANVLNITAATGSAQSAAQLANAFAEQYIAFESNSQLSSISAAENRLKLQIAPLSSESAERASLQKKIQQLGELRAGVGATSQIIGRARPADAPSGTTTKTAALLGLLVGLALAFSLLFLIESLDKRVKTIDEFEDEYRLPVLTGVPQSTFRFPLAAERKQFLEPYRILRSALDLAAVTRQLDSVLVTSAVSGEGKTGVAVDLAHAIALTGRRVVLVEADLRRPTVARHLGFGAGSGLTNVLAGSDSLADLLIQPLPELPNFSALRSGRLPPNPSELLGSTSLAEVITELMSNDTFVILDAPPLLPVSDTQELLNNSVVHGTLIVARIGRTTRDEVRLARAILNRHMVEPIGLVVTGLRDLDSYGYDVDASAGAEPPAGGEPRTRVLRARSQRSSAGKPRELHR
jgi:capsular exopolysaccharide synthesis family protein